MNKITMATKSKDVTGQDTSRSEGYDREECKTTQLTTSGHEGDSRDTISAGAAPENQRNPTVYLKSID